MKISQHSENSKNLTGHHAHDIHKWIDGFFDYESFSEFLVGGKKEGYNPYEHRKYRHCSESLEDAYKEFKGKYTEEDIKKIFESHIKDDYDGYIPRREDFINGKFKEKYHESNNYNQEEKILNKNELNEYFKNKVYSQKKRINTVSSTSFLYKIIIPTIITIILFAYLIFYIIIPKSRSNMLKIKKEMVEELTNAASSIIERHIKSSINGVPLRKAQQLAIQEIRSMKYGKNHNNYFWITDMTPKMIMHPINPELEGKDLSTFREEESGKQLFVEFVNLVKKNGSGYLEYNWQKDKTHLKHIPKFSFVKKINTWNWIIGTGIYLDDVELEMKKLTQNTIYMSILIFSILLLILYYIVLQSYKIERIKQKAEEGLLEAKNRYRALVEASNEGYILEVNGTNIICNNTVKRMLGYDDDELSDIAIWNKLLPDTNINQAGKEHLKNFFLDHTNSKEFEAQLKTRRGILIDAILSTSRIFFHNENAHLVTIRQIVNNIDFTTPNLLKNRSETIDLVEEIKNSLNDGHILQTINQLPQYVRLMLKNKESSKMRTLVCDVFEASVNKFINTVIKEIGPPPSEFMFVSLGSHARQEMTMFSDQDNAIIFNSDKNELEKNRLYFLKLADKICFKLNQAGYKYCLGGIMATNPTWCLSSEEWKIKCEKLIINPTPEALLNINIIFDIYKVYGNNNLFSRLQKDMLSSLKQQPQFFNNYAINCQQYQIPINIFGSIKSKEYVGGTVINIKECLSPIVLFARIYSLKHNITDVETLQRLDAMFKLDIISETRLKEIKDAFHYLWYLRFYNQIICHSNLKTINDNLDISQLPTEERRKLKNILSTLTTLNNKISYDFLGVSI